jgi:preprotein translocase subunit SecE
VKIVFNKAIQFLREVIEELRKVSWSNKKQTIGSAMVVILLVIAVAIFVGLVDFGLSIILGILIK